MKTSGRCNKQLRTRDGAIWVTMLSGKRAKLGTCTLTRGHSCPCGAIRLLPEQDLPEPDDEPGDPVR